MMPMNDTRLFKATRRTIRAEVTLVIVIIISFSWSAYALYKLVLGNSDSLFDPSPASTLQSSSPSPTHVKGPIPLAGNHSNLASHSEDAARHPLEAINEQHLAALNLTEQLAIYKSQILKELLARQRRLLFGGGGDAIDHQQLSTHNTPNGFTTQALDGPRSMPMSLRPVASDQSAQQAGHNGHQRPAVAPFNIAELTNWQGGYKLPPSVDYLFQSDNRAARSSSSAPIGAQQLIENPDRAVQSSNSDYGQTTPSPSLIQLTDAPSLMQLSKSKPSAQQKGIKEFSLSHDERDLESDKQPPPPPPPPARENGAQHDEANLDDTSGDERQYLPSTTEAPPQVMLESDPAALETTTAEPAASETSETTPAPGELDEPETAADRDRSAVRPPVLTPNDNESSAEPARGETTSPSESDNETNDDDGATMERVKNTVHAIDEEVDRMTQPSSGMVSQQDKSFDYKNTVQFDDGLPGTVQREVDNNIRARISKPGDGASGASASNSNRRSGLAEGAEQADSPADLLVADNQAKPPPIDVSHRTPPTPMARHQSQGPLRSTNELPKENPRRRMKDELRQKLVRRQEARRPFDGRDQATRMGKLRRDKRSIETNLITKTLDTIDPKATKNNKSEKRQRKKKRKKTRRSDDEDEEQEDDESNDDQAVGQEAGQDGQDKPEDDQAQNYQTITSNDPTLQELLAHKQLLDALEQSQLPAPLGSKANQQLQPQPQRLNSTFMDPIGQQTSSQKATTEVTNGDHQPADTHYTIDQGLLLYPAADEEHHHKSKSKKSKKMSHKKGKKKMTVAMKKGGHKKKKHKKEEKKYLKEKKFKGAKKGKKMSKGKGGKGGKKGKKYYKDKGFKKKGFKNIYVKNEFGQKKSYFDEFRDKDFKKKWKNFDDKYKYAQMKKWQAKDVKGAKKMKSHGEKFKKYDKGKWKKKYHKHQESESAKKKKKYDEF